MSFSSEEKVVTVALLAFLIDFDNLSVELIYHVYGDNLLTVLAPLVDFDNLSGILTYHGRVANLSLILNHHVDVDKQPEIFTTRLLLIMCP